MVTSFSSERYFIVPSIITRNLICVSCLDNKNIHYIFRNRKYINNFNKIDFDLAIIQDKTYLLPNYDHVNDIHVASFVNLCTVKVKSKQNKN
jgi:hypothetical protein